MAPGSSRSPPKRSLSLKNFRPNAVLGFQSGMSWRASFSATAARINSLLVAPRGMRRKSDFGNFTVTTFKFVGIPTGYYTSGALESIELPDAASVSHGQDRCGIGVSVYG